MKQAKFLLPLFFIISQALFAQSSLVGSKIESLEITEFLKNKPSELSFNNKYKVLEFWASWCAPCLAAVPHINELQDKFKDNKELVFISLTYEKPEIARRAMNKVDFKTIVATDQSKGFFKKLQVEKNGIMSLPTTILVDNNNEVKWIGTPKDLNAELIKSFLSGEKIGQKEISKAIVTEEAPQSVQKTLVKKRDDENLKFAFSIEKAVDSDIKSLIMNGYFGQFIFSKTPLTQVLSSLQNIPEHKILFLDSTLASDSYNVFYKNSFVKKEGFNLETFNNEKKAVIRKIVESLDLVEKVVTKPTEVFEIKVLDETKLVLTEETVQSKSSSGEGVISIMNGNLENVSATLSNMFRKIILYKGTNPNKFDFTLIHNNSIESLEKSLETYGLKLYQSTENVDYFQYEKK